MGDSDNGSRALTGGPGVGLFSQVHRKRKSQGNERGVAPPAWSPPSGVAMGFAAYPHGSLICLKTAGQLFCPWEARATGQSYLGEGTLMVSFALSSSNLVYDDGNQPRLHMKSEKKDPALCYWP